MLKSRNLSVYVYVKLTLQIQVLPDPEQHRQLKETMERFNTACDWLAGEAFVLRSANKVKLQQLYYATIRDRFGLSAQMTVRCIARTCEMLKRDRTKRPHVRKHAAVPYDQRLLSFKGIDKVSLLTLAGRIICPIVMGAYQRERFTPAVGQSDLVLRKDGKWFLLCVVEVPDGTPLPTSDFIGVDLGATNLATTSDGEHFSGEKVEAVRQRYHDRRRTLQRAAVRRKAKGKRSRSIRRALRRCGQREQRFRRNENHRISKQLVDRAIDTGRGIALEELTHIRSRTRFRSRQRAKMSGWAFAQLRAFLTYKAQRARVPILLVDPRHTSQQCPVCSHTARANRPSQSQFRCRVCGFALHADIVGALNIRARAVVNQLMVASEQHSSLSDKPATLVAGH